MKKKMFSIFLCTVFLLIGVPPVSGGAYSVVTVGGELSPVEAEFSGAELNAPFLRMTDDPDASGGGYVTVARTAAFNSSQKNSDPGELQYYITVQEPKTYYIWARVKALNISSTSVWYRTDNKSWSIKEIRGANQWQWMQIGTESMGAGQHLIEFAHRDIGYSIDQLVFAASITYQPEPNNMTDTEYLQQFGYSFPSITPPAEHPRVFLRSADIPRIRQNLTHPQNVQVYQYLLHKSQMETDGTLPALANGASTNMNTSYLECMEANAFLYLMEGDAVKGRKAVAIAKNMIRTLENQPVSATRMGGQGIYDASLVYDWCYPLMTDAERTEIRDYVLAHARTLEVGWPPLQTGDVLGHNAEAQLNKDLLTAGIAFYDEDPKVYNIVAGRILSGFVPVRNYAYQSMTFSEGPSYGRFRYAFDLICAYLFRGMGYDNVYDSAQKNPAYGLLYARKPDGKYIPTGDDVTKSVYGYDASYASVFFMAGNLYQDPYLKREYYRNLQGGKSTSTVISDVSAVMHLIMNDVDVEPSGSFRDFPLTAYSGAPFPMMTARTSWEDGLDSDSMTVQMNLQGSAYGSHQHADAGHFDIYYKGALAIDSGLYESAAFQDENGNAVTSLGYASLHDMNYHKRTAAHNSMLVYDPNEQVSSVYTKHADGGQRLTAGSLEPKNLLEMQREENKTAEVLGYDFGPNAKQPAHSYLKGDLTKAYANSKVEQYSRSFLFLNFFDEEYPGALIVLDNITSTDASFRKSWLLHSEEEPQTEGTRTTVQRTESGYHGKLVNDTLLPQNPQITKVGGAGHEFESGGINWKAVPKTKTTEAGKWRIEVSPRTAAKNDVFLNVLQVSDSQKNLPPLEVQLVENNEQFVGVQIKNRVAYLAKGDVPVSGSFSVKTQNAQGSFLFTVTGVQAGKWTVKNAQGNTLQTCETAEGRNVITFSASAGEYTLSHSDATVAGADLSLFSNLTKTGGTAIDVKLNSMFESFQAEPLLRKDALYLPVGELMQKTNPEYRQISATCFQKEDSTVEFFPQSREISVNGIRTKLTEPFLRQNRVLYAPAGEILTALGHSFSWDSVGKVAWIRTGSTPQRTLTPRISNVACAYDEATGKHHITLDVQVFDGSTACSNREVTLLMAGNCPGKVSETVSFTYGGTAREGYVYYLGQGNTGAQGKASFDFYAVLPLQATNPEDYLFAFSAGGSAAKAAAEKSVSVRQITYTVGEGGTVSAEGIPLQGAGALGVAEGTVLHLTPIPTEGYRVGEVRYNGALLVPNAEGIYSVQAADGVLTVSYQADETQPGVHTYENVIYPSEDGKIFFGQVKQASGYQKTEWGMLYSASNPEPLLQAADCRRLTSKKALSAKGQFGIELLSLPVRDYYIRSYAIYQRGTEEPLVVYGTVIHIDGK